MDSPDIPTIVNKNKQNGLNPFSLKFNCQFMMKKLVGILLICMNVEVSLAQPSFIKQDLDKYILKGMKDWNVPGLSIVIVKDGKVVLMKGYGVRDIETKQLVDENTLFMIASNTKLFTGTALALLEYRGRLSLNDKITKYFPDYRLYDSTSTALVSIKDMLSHRIGTKTYQGDFTFWNSKLSRSEIMQKMRYLKPIEPFRQTYGYCNSCFLVAGEVIPVVTRQPWEVFIFDSIIMPLDMQNTHMLSAGIDQRRNVATPYTTSYSEKLTVVPYDQWDNLAPAASIVSNVKDLSNWLLFQIDSGRYKNKQILPFEVLQKTREAVSLISSKKNANYPMHLRGYGLGLNTADYAGRQIYWHTGGAGGMVSNVCFVPEENLGIAILTNNDDQSFYELLRYQVLDAYLKLPFKNHSQRQLTIALKDRKEQLDQIKNWRARRKGNAPPLPFENYVGEYNNQIYGDISINKAGQQLLIRFKTHPMLYATLDYLDNGEWLLAYTNVEYGIFTTKFEEVNGKVLSLTVKANDYVEYDPYVFRKL